jgi:hypothetical protein
MNENKSLKLPSIPHQNATISTISNSAVFAHNVSHIHNLNNPSDNNNTSQLSNDRKPPIFRSKKSSVIKQLKLKKEIEAHNNGVFCRCKAHLAQVNEINSYIKSITRQDQGKQSFNQ